MWLGDSRWTCGHCAPYLSLPAASVTPRQRHLEWFHDHVRIEQELFDGTLDPVGGRLRTPDRPGHGLSLRHDVLQEKRT